MPFLRIIATTIFLAAYLAPGVSSKPQKKILCRFAGKEYSPGDVWYPAQERYCIRCSCLNTGKLNCTSQECPVDCSTTDQGLEHPCCKTCSNVGDLTGGLQGRGAVAAAVVAAGADSEAGDNAAGGSSGFSLGRTRNSSGDDEDEEETFVTENSEFVSCLHQGKIYRDREAFTANVTGLPISAADQCMQCVCESGMVLCKLESCSTVKCGGSSSSASSSSDTCCQRCSAWRGGRRVKMDDDDTDMQTFSTSSDHKDSRDVNGDIISSGFSIGIGSHQESSVTFRDVSAALDGQDKGRAGKNKQPADDCISGGRFYVHGSKWHPIIGPFGIMECVICTCSSGEIDCNRLKCPPKKDLPCAKPAKVEGHCCPICTTSPGTGDGLKMCVSGKQDVTAYKSHGFGLNDTELFQFGFVKQRRNLEAQIDHHEWTLKSGEIIQFTTRYISLEDFSDLRNRQTFVLLGATNEKNVEKFTRREKKLEKRCTSRCGIRILGLERSLRIHRLTSRKLCLPHERTLST